MLSVLTRVSGSTPGSVPDSFWSSAWALGPPRSPSIIPEDNHPTTASTMRAATISDFFIVSSSVQKPAPGKFSCLHPAKSWELPVVRPFAAARSSPGCRTQRPPQSNSPYYPTVTVSLGCKLLPTAYSITAWTKVEGRSGRSHRRPKRAARDAVSVRRPREQAAPPLVTPRLRSRPAVRVTHTHRGSPESGASEHQLPAGTIQYSSHGTPNSARRRSSPETYRRLSLHDAGRAFFGDRWSSTVT